MAKPTPHTALEGMGFKLADKRFNGSSDRVGTATTHHYTLTRNSTGNGQIIRPVTHHVFVDEFSKSPGKYNASYYVTQDGQPYSDGDFDTLRNHKDNVHRGSSDPIKDIMYHHQGIVGVFKGEKAPPLEDVTPENLHRLVNGPYHTTPGWDASDPEMKGQRFIRRGPEHNPMIHLNATQDWPLDPHVYRRLTGGRHGRPTFEYKGRFPGDNGVDVYHASYDDPESPGTYKYGFTIRHNPSLERPFSYNAEHHPNTSDENGEEPVGKFLDVTGMRDPVVNFSNVGSAIERHHNMLRHLRLMPPRPPEKPKVYMAGINKRADGFDDIVGGNGFAGPCRSCGKATYNNPSSFREDNSYPVTAEDEASDMHGPDINLCGTCASDEDVHRAAVQLGSKGRDRLWHYDDQGVPGCPECESHLMDQADEDLQP